MTATTVAIALGLASAAPLPGNRAAARPLQEGDATYCVSEPSLRANASFQGNTAAYVTNNCSYSVDIRVCLENDRGWNCGVSWGVRAGARWSHSSFRATGEYFYDARATGSSRRLRSPE